jgi:Cu(I)/Ag(I) efflux system membrane fusion protein
MSHDDNMLPPSERDAMPEGEEAPPRGAHAMAILRWILIVSMAVGALAAWLSYAGVWKKVGHSPVAYYCPMHPSVQQDHPGECPICSMTLVPKDKGASAKPEPTSAPARDGGAVAGLVPIDLSPERIQRMGMRTASVERERLVPELRTVGYVSANEEGLARIQPRFSGWIVDLFVDKTGQRVSKGQALATIYSPELLTAQQELLNARKWSARPTGDAPESHHLSIDLADDARRRLELLGIAEEDIATMEKTGKPVRALPLRSTVSGYVTTKTAVQGLYVQPGGELFQIADLSTVWVLADVYENEIDRVRPGAPARLELAAHPGRSFGGRVQFVYPNVDSTTRTLKARLAFKNPDLWLRPGMYGNVSIQLKAAEGLTIPADALVDTGESQYVFLALAGGHFEPRPVRVGFRSGSKVEILSGLQAGDVVVTTANFLIDSESRLHAAITEEGPGANGAAQGPSCGADFDRTRFPDKYEQCRRCEIVHRGMGSMEQDCKNAIPRPWR